MKGLAVTRRCTCSVGLISLAQIKHLLTNVCVKCVNGQNFHIFAILYSLHFTQCSNERPPDAQMRYFGEVLLEKPGFGTRCMADEPLE